MLRRSRSDWPVVFASWALLASALGLLAAGTLYTDAVTLAGLHRELAVAPAVDRSIVVRTQILPEILPIADAAITPELERVIAPTGGEITRVLRSGPYADAATPPDAVADLVLFAALEGVRDHATIAAGRWPEPGGTPVEVAVSEPAAAILNVAPGDRIPLVGRLDGRPVEAVVTGTWRADPADPYWLGDPLLLAGNEPGGSFRLVGPLLAEAADLEGPLAGGRPVDAQWRAIPDLAGFRPENLDEVAASLPGLLGEVNAALPGSNQATVATKLAAIVASVDRSVLVAQSGILLLLVQFGVLAGYSVILVAALLVDRRRPGTALLQARGAGFGHLVRMATGEALVIVVPAVLAAPWIASLLVTAVGLNPALEGVGLTAPLPTPATFGVAAITGLLALLALVLPTLSTGLRFAGIRAAVGRQVGRTLPQRLGLDLALVLLAALALFQLRLYGAPITRNARGALGVDPLLVAAPAIGLLAGAVIAVRIVPRIAEIAERVLSRGRGLVPSMGGRQVARRPLRYTRAALLLVLAAALGTFASAHAATWTRSQADQAAFVSGADVRLEPGTQSAVPDWALGEALRSLPGVTAATPVVEASVSLGTALRDGKVLGIDGPAMADVIRQPDSTSADATRGMLQSLAEGRPAAPGLAVADGTSRLSVVIDSTFTAEAGLRDGPARLRGPRRGRRGRRRRREDLAHRGHAGGARGRGGAIRHRPRAARLGGSPDAAGPRPRHRARAVPHRAAGHAGQRRHHRPRAGNEPRPGRGQLDRHRARGHLPAVVDHRRRRRWRSLRAGPAGRARRPHRGPSASTEWRLSFGRVSAPEIAALANPVFLERTGARVGDTLEASIFGLPVTIRLLGAVDGFPSQPSAKPLLLVDGPSLDLARYAGGVTLAPTVRVVARHGRGHVRGCRGPCDLGADRGLGHRGALGSRGRPRR